MIGSSSLSQVLSELDTLIGRANMNSCPEAEELTAMLQTVRGVMDMPERLRHKLLRSMTEAMMKDKD